MINRGFPRFRFQGLEFDEFDCAICENFARSPRECQGCRNVYCDYCLKTIPSKKGQPPSTLLPCNKPRLSSEQRVCPKGCCAEVSTFSDKMMAQRYGSIFIQCVNYNKCKTVCQLKDLESHQDICGKLKCWNSDNCHNIASFQDNLDFPSCSSYCSLLRKIIDVGLDQKRIYDEILKFKVEKHIQREFNEFPKLICSTLAVKTPQDTAGLWDPRCFTGSLELSEDGTTVFLRQESETFKNVFSATGFTGGINYWEIVVHPETTDELIVGVSTTNQIADRGDVFSNYTCGYAYSGKAQLRHNSYNTGRRYGKEFKNEGVIGVYLNMIKGILSFSLNGQYLGVAYTNQAALKKGPIYPTVALLRCGGCRLVRHSSIPACFKD